MALRYELSLDVAALPIIGSESAGGLAVEVTEDVGGTPRVAQISITAGTYTHSDISSVDAGFTVFAVVLKAALDGSGTLTGTYTVEWNGTTGYSIVNNQGAVLDLKFSAATTSEHGTNLRRLLGFHADQTGAAGTTGYTSTMRPYYMVLPASQGRTEYTRDRGRPDFAEDAEADDGSSVFIARGTAVKIGDWIQVGEIETVPATFSDVGTPTHKDMVDAGTSANDVPWSWEHFFEHAAMAKHRLSVFEGAAHEVWELRADGLWFDPSRWSGTDQPLWRIPLRCRLIGRV